jgi:hypothetical protein
MKKLSVKEAEHKVQLAALKLNSACDDLSIALEEKFGMEFKCYPNSGGEIDVEFPNGDIWEFGTAIRLLEEDVDSPTQLK